LQPPTTKILTQFTISIYTYINVQCSLPKQKNVVHNRQGFDKKINKQKSRNIYSTFKNRDQGGLFASGNIKHILS
jgi:hypothetical protein